MLRIHEIKLKWNEDMQKIPAHIEKKLGRVRVSVADWRVVRESVDARDKNDVRRVFTVDFSVKTQPQEAADAKEDWLIKATSSHKQLKIEKAPQMRYVAPQRGRKPLQSPPVIIGFGPCGIFAALLLSRLGYRPLVLERGKAMEERVSDVERFWQTGRLLQESNVQFGEGGAGTFSDGKLTTQIRDHRVRYVLEELVNCGAPQDILYQQKPHIGTDLLRRIVVKLRGEIERNGGAVLFQKQCTDLCLENNRIKGVVVNGSQIIETEQVILAVGHSARDTLRMLLERQVPMERKPFSLGVRIEHRQAMVDEAQYGNREIAKKLGPADYKLSYRCQNGRGVYTFCMCPGGVVVGAASECGGVVTNGMSYHDRGEENANSALLVDVRPDDFPCGSVLAGVEFQEKYERRAFVAGGGDYRAPAQRLGDFLQGAPTIAAPPSIPVRPSYQPGIRWADLTECLPKFATDSMREAIPWLGKRLKGFDHPDAVMTGVETRSSSPVRILRAKDHASEMQGLYPAGEGAGYAGGIASAAVDGLKTAEEIVKVYSNSFATDGTVFK